MRLENISKRTYQHSVLKDDMKVEILELKPGQNKEIPDEVARQWLKTGEVREYISPVEAKAVEETLKAEKTEIEKENEKLKAELEELKKQLKNKPVEAKAVEEEKPKKNGRHK